MFPARLPLLIGLFLLVALPVAAEQVHKRPEAFLKDAFAGDVPQARTLWLTPELREGVRRILDHDLNLLRVRYWARGPRTAWILEEIGKTEPITTGIVVDSRRIHRLEVLIYRESHGGEVRYPAFTEQFRGALLGDGNRLDRGIDGISGATLSVNALIRLARLALYLDRHAEHPDG